MGCNGWNHASDCNCGWGGWGWDAGRTTTNGGRYQHSSGVDLGNFSDEVLKENNTVSPFVKKLDKLLISKERILKNNLLKSKEPMTYKVDCWWCQTSVFYHTNGYGDHVLFDHLGYPWKIHQCWEDYWRNKKTYSTIKTKKQDLVFFSLSEKEKLNIINQGEILCEREKLNILQELIRYTNIPTEEELASNLGIFFIEDFRKIFKSLYYLCPDKRYGKLLVKIKISVLKKLSSINPEYV